MSHRKNLHRQLADTLSARGDELAAQGHLDDAVSVYFQSLGLRSNNPALLRKIGHLYEQSGESEAARMCQLGVIPDAANERYFDAAALGHKLLTVDNSPSTETYRISASENVALTPPVAHGKPGKYNQFNRRQTECRGCLLTRTTAGEVWFDGLNTLVIDKERNILREHGKGNELLAWRAATTKPPSHLPGRVCFLDARSSAIYYHWMLDVLPKLHILTEAGIALDSIDTFVVRATSVFQLATLERFGIPREKVYFEDFGTHISADELLVPLLKNDLGDKIYTGLGLGVASWVPDFLKSSFLDQPTAIEGSPPSRRIYITRKDASSRRLLNEQELEPLLKDFGFEACQFDGMSVAAQAKLMSEVDCIVAPHGAGLTNLAFCQSGGKLLEIFGDYIVPCYWSLSNLVGLEYHYFMADAAEQHPSRPQSTIHSTGSQAREVVAQRRAKDLIVEPESLERALKTLCS
ncbi:MAG: glycosyltransferase family 61 protein [Granulosicoccus sp.]|nr:glycosyltransferase family 61 protein [Granulosicoccus sp.]